MSSFIVFYVWLTQRIISMVHNLVPPVIHVLQCETLQRKGAYDSQFIWEHPGLFSYYWDKPPPPPPTLSHTQLENFISAPRFLQIPGLYILVYLWKWVIVLIAQLCPTLSDPMDCGPPGSSVHEILQASILEWVAIPYSKGSSWPRDQTWVSLIAGRFLTLPHCRQNHQGSYL